MTDMRMLRVFMASPTDANEERALVRKVVEKINRELSSQGTKFSLLGWENKPGTARRPQDAINELIDDSDFMLCIFRQKWGSHPGGDTYTSGTEEELFTGLLKLADEKSPMRDVCLVFTDYQGEQRESRVDNLYNEIVASKTLFFESIENQSEFSARIRSRFLDWARHPVHKTPQFAHIKPSSGRDVIGAFQLCREAEVLASIGVTNQADIRFKKAMELGGLQEKLAYAVFLGRQSRVAEALQVVADSREEILVGPRLEVVSLVEVMLVEASLKRRDRDLDGAWASLATALSTLNGGDGHRSRLKSRIHDELGVLAYRQGLEYRRKGQMQLSGARFAEARRHLEEGRRERCEMHDDLGVAQSDINLGRLGVALGQYESAVSSHSSAIEQLGPIANGTLANAYLARAQALLAAAKQSVYVAREMSQETQDLLDRALDDANHALHLNRTLQLKRNEAMVLNVLAQIYDANGDAQCAKEHAEVCVKLNHDLGSTPPPKAIELAAIAG